MNTEEFGKAARIVVLREELQRKRKELKGLLVEYVDINRDPEKPVPWRLLARRIGMDHMQLFRLARRKGLVADGKPKRIEPVQP